MSEKATPAPDSLAEEKARRRAEALRLEAEALGNAPKAAEPEPEEPFERGIWGQYERYQCRYCPWDTLHEDLAWEHYANYHVGKGV